MAYNCEIGIKTDGSLSPGNIFALTFNKVFDAACKSRKIYP